MWICVGFSLFFPYFLSLFLFFFVTLDNSIWKMFDFPPFQFETLSIILFMLFVFYCIGCLLIFYDEFLFAFSCENFQCTTTTAQSHTVVVCSWKRNMCAKISSQLKYENTDGSKCIWVDEVRMRKWNKEKVHRQQTTKRKWKVAWKTFLLHRNKIYKSEKKTYTHHR